MEGDVASSPTTTTTTTAAPLSPLLRLLRVCGQEQERSKLPSMDSLLARHVCLAGVAKCGEGTFGEAFRCRGGAVVKVVPFVADDAAAAAILAEAAEKGREWEAAVARGNLSSAPTPEGDDDDDDQDDVIDDGVIKTAAELLAEAEIGLALTSLAAGCVGEEDEEGEEASSSAPPLRDATSGFCATRAVGVCSGPYSATLAAEWESWRRGRGTDNLHPRSRAADRRVLYAVFVADDGGADLEAALSPAAAFAAVAVGRASPEGPRGRRLPPGAGYGGAGRRGGGPALRAQGPALGQRPAAEGRGRRGPGRRRGGGEGRRAAREGGEGRGGEGEGDAPRLFALPAPRRWARLRPPRGRCGAARAPDRLHALPLRLRGRRRRGNGGPAAAARGPKQKPRQPPPAASYCDLSSDPLLFRGPRGDPQSETYRAMAKVSRGDWQAFSPEYQRALDQLPERRAPGLRRRLGRCRRRRRRRRSEAAPRVQEEGRGWLERQGAAGGRDIQGGVGGGDREKRGRERGERGEKRGREREREIEREMRVEQRRERERVIVSFLCFLSSTHLLFVLFLRFSFLSLSWPP